MKLTPNVRAKKESKKKRKSHLSIELQFDVGVLLKRELMSGPDGLVRDGQEQEVVEQEGHQLLPAFRLPDEAVVEKFSGTHLKENRAIK